MPGADQWGEDTFEYTVADPTGSTATAIVTVVVTPVHVGLDVPVAEAHRVEALERGDDPQSFFGRVYFAGGYQQAIQAVANGLVDAAGVSEFADLLLSPEQQSEVTWIAESEPIPAHAVIARKGLDPALKQRFVAAMLKLNEPQNRWLLQHVYAPDGYVEARPEAYEPVAEVARHYGLLS